MAIDHRRAEPRSSSPSVLQGDETFYNRVISRDSSSSSSSVRVFYCRSAAEGGVPFNWETQPGTPKNPPKEDSIPPISPPPAVLSLSLPKPSFHGDGQRGGGGRSSNARKQLKLLWKFLVGRRRRRQQGRWSEKVENKNGRRSWDDEAAAAAAEDFVASPRNSSFSSSATSSRSSSNDDGYSRLSSSSGSETGRRKSNADVDGCGGGRPWNINSMLVCVSGKV